MNILLISNDMKLYNVTKEVLSDKRGWIVQCGNSMDLIRSQIFDLAIVDFNEEKIGKAIFKDIIKIKGRFGANIPILAILDGGTIQDVFEVLHLGAFDYMYKDRISRDYKRKLENIFRWKWYLKKYRDPLIN